jgi:hypothetical protein
MSVPSLPSALGRLPESGPWFCPRCGRAGVGASTDASPRLCRDCGEELVPQGYCAVCESHWALTEGLNCPKHDIALVAGMRAENRPNVPFERLVTVGSFADTSRAEALRIRLEAEGIPTFLEGERMGSLSMYQVATGGVKVQVPESLAADARILLTQSWSMTPAAGQDDDLDDAWEDLAPDPGATYRDLGRLVVLLFLFSPLVLSLLAYWLNSH